MEKTTQYMIPLTQNGQKRQIYRDRKQINGFSGWGVGVGLTANGQEGIFAVIKMSPYWII